VDADRNYFNGEGDHLLFESMNEPQDANGGNRYGGGTSENWGPINTLNQGAGTANGTRVQLYDCNGSAAQRWTINAGGDITNPVAIRSIIGLVVAGFPQQVSSQVVSKELPRFQPAWICDQKPLSVPPLLSPGLIRGVGDVGEQLRYGRASVTWVAARRDAKTPGKRSSAGCGPVVEGDRRGRARGRISTHQSSAY